MVLLISKLGKTGLRKSIKTSCIEPLCSEWSLKHACMTIPHCARRHLILSACGVRGKYNVQFINMSQCTHTFLLQLVMLVSLGVQGYDKYEGQQNIRGLTENLTKHYHSAKYVFITNKYQINYNCKIILTKKG